MKNSIFLHTTLDVFVVTLVLGFCQFCNAASEQEAKLANAPPSQVFTVEISFEQTIPVAAIRQAIGERLVPRVLAYVNRDPLTNGRHSGAFILLMGQLYAEGKPRRHAECQALRYASTALAQQTINDWPVTRIHVLADALNLLELIRDSRLPGLSITQVNPVSPRHAARLSKIVSQEVSEPIFIQQSTTLPGYCNEFLKLPDAPTLAGGFPPEFVPPLREKDEDDIAFAYRVIANLGTDSAVTMSLQLAVSSSIESIARLVDDYNIEGMSVELSPVNSNARMILLAEISPYGDGVDSAVHRTQCRASMNEDRLAREGDWLSGWITVSLHLADAVRLLSHQGIQIVRVDGAFRPEAFSRLQRYYEARSQRIESVPSWIEIPPRCNNEFVVDPSLKRGAMFRAVNE